MREREIGHSVRVPQCISPAGLKSFMYRDSVGSEERASKRDGEKRETGIE